MRLLLVEDEPSLRESVARKLHRAGYEQMTAVMGKPRWKCWRQSGMTLFCWILTCPEWMG